MGSPRYWAGGVLLALFSLNAAANEYPSEWRARELLGTARTGSTVTGTYEFLRSSTSSTLPTLYRSEQVMLQRATLATVARRGLSLARLGVGGPWGAAALALADAAGWFYDQQTESWQQTGEQPLAEPPGDWTWPAEYYWFGRTGGAGYGAHATLADAVDAYLTYHQAGCSGAYVSALDWQASSHEVDVSFGCPIGGSLPEAALDLRTGCTSALASCPSEGEDETIPSEETTETLSDDDLLDELVPAIDPSRWEGIMEDEDGHPIRYPEVRDMEWELTKSDPANDAEGLPQDAPSTWAPSDDPAAGDSTAPEETEFPAFCAWAGPLCEWLEWTQEPPPDEEPPPLPTTEVDVSDGLNAWDSGLGAGSCPAPMSVSLGPFGGPIAIPYDPFCDFAAAIRPMVIAAGMLIGLMIVVRRV